MDRHRKVSWKDKPYIFVWQYPVSEKVGTKFSPIDILLDGTDVFIIEESSLQCRVHAMVDGHHVEGWVMSSGLSKKE